jgi:hypothetical protein
MQFDRRYLCKSIFSNVKGGDPMNLRRPAWAIISFIVVMTIGVAACKSVQMNLLSIPEDDIPQAVRDFTDTLALKLDGGSHGDIGLTFHVSTPKDGRHMVAWTYYRAGDENRPILMVASFPINDAAEVAAFDDHSVDVEFNKKRDCQGDFSYGTFQREDGKSRLKMAGGGLCLNPDLVKIVGTTTYGNTAETTPTDGFWYLFINNTRTVEKWSKVVGLDKDGNIIEDLSPGVLAGSDHIIH